LFTPGVAVLIGYVVLVGNPWLNRDLTFALSDADSAIRLFDVMFFYPSWHVDVDRVGPFLFWFGNMRVVLFVALAVAGLNRLSRWVSESAGGVGLFVTTVGLTTLSAVTAGLASAVAGVILLNPRATRPYFTPDRPEEFFMVQFGESAVFGVLFGLVLGAAVVMQRRTSTQRRVSAPKSFW
jgi:hypothetical protein